LAASPGRYLEDELFDVVGHPTVIDWLQYNAEAGGYDVRVERDDNSVEMPKARYAFFQVDQVLRGRTPAGLSLDLGYIANEHAFVSLATVDLAASQPGTEVTVLWGEEPNSAKPAVEQHRQVEIRATVALAPYVQEVRDSYRKS
jgi:hypothetical protein